MSLKRFPFLILLLVLQNTSLHAQPVVTPVNPFNNSKERTGLKFLKVVEQSADKTEVTLSMSYVYNGESGPTAKLIPVIGSRRTKGISAWFGSDNAVIGRGRGIVSMKVRYFNDEAGVPPVLDTDQVQIYMLRKDNNQIIRIVPFLEKITWGTPGAQVAMAEPSLNLPPPPTVDKAALAEEAQKRREQEEQARKQEEEARQRKLLAEREALARQEAERQARLEADRLEKERLQAAAEAEKARLEMARQEAERKALQEAEARKLAEEKAAAEEKARKLAADQAKAMELARQSAEKLLNQSPAESAPDATPPPPPSGSPEAVIREAGDARSKIKDLSVLSRSLDRTEATLGLEVQYREKNLNEPLLGVKVTRTGSPEAEKLFKAPPVDLEDSRSTSTFVLPVKFDPPDPTSSRYRRYATDQVSVFLADNRSQQQMELSEALVYLNWRAPGSDASSANQSAISGSVPGGLKVDTIKQYDVYSGYVTIHYELAKGPGRLKVVMYDTTNPLSYQWFDIEERRVPQGRGFELVKIKVKSTAQNATDLLSPNKMEIVLMDANNEVAGRTQQEMNINWVIPR